MHIKVIVSALLVLVASVAVAKDQPECKSEIQSLEARQVELHESGERVIQLHEKIGSVTIDRDHAGLMVADLLVQRTKSADPEVRLRLGEDANREQRRMYEMNDQLEELEAEVAKEMEETNRVGALLEEAIVRFPEECRQSRKKGR